MLVGVAQADAQAGLHSPGICPGKIISNLHSAWASAWGVAHPRHAHDTPISGCGSHACFLFLVLPGVLPGFLPGQLPGLLPGHVPGHLSCLGDSNTIP